MILQQLMVRSQTWTELEKATVKASPTFSSFRSTLIWLLKNGYIERPSRGVYEITDRGRIFLKAL